MQAILIADYSFKPDEYWRNVSNVAREFIQCCLTIDPSKRITAHEALNHPWINPVTEETVTTPRRGSGEDLLPTVKRNFNARRTLHKAIDTVRAINKLREAGGLMMDDGSSGDPRPQQEDVDGNQVRDHGGQEQSEAAQGALQPEADKMDIDAKSVSSEQKTVQPSGGLWTPGDSGSTNRR